MPKKGKSKSKGKSVQLWKRYENGKLKGKLCPKCKSFLAEMKDRTYCGKCKYVEQKKAA
jgi:ribosomal protein S27AE